MCVPTCECCYVQPEWLHRLIPAITARVTLHLWPVWRQLLSFIASASCNNLKSHYDIKFHIHIFVKPLLLPSPLPPFIPLLSPSRTNRSQVISCSPSPPPSSALCSLVTTQESSMLQRWLVNISNLMWCRLHTIGDISYCKDCKYLISQAF